MSKPRDDRHRYGQHYTPAEVARLLAAFAVRSAQDIVLDPACGDGRLLSEALVLKRGFELSAGRAACREVFGLDRSRSAVELASRTGAQVAAADFFSVVPGATAGKSVRLPRSFDAIIGNPPYIRQEIIGNSGKRRIETRLARDAETLPEIIWSSWSGRSDIYVYFFAHAAGFLKEGGRLVFLTASSWLDVGYGRALREFLLNNFRIVAIIESAAESFFSDASINTAITVVEREPDAGLRAANLVRFVRLDNQLSAIKAPANSRHKKGRLDQARAMAKEIERTHNSITKDEYRIRVVDQASLMADCSDRPWERRHPPRRQTGKKELAKAKLERPPAEVSGWGKYLRAEDVFFDILERGGARLRPLAGLAKVRFGVKTGANEFFYVTERGGQSRSGIASVRRGLTTGANEFFYLTHQPAQSPTRSSQRLTAVLDASGRTRQIESRFLSPVIFSLKEIPGIALDRAEGGKMFFHCSEERDQLVGTEALTYIEQGERYRYDERPTCAAREPWYSVANGLKPAPLIFPSKVGERWLIALNRARVFEDKKLYGLFPSNGVSELALAALLNSTWARYFAEITCRQMTGAQAIADIDVAVAERIMIPDPRELLMTIKGRLEGALLRLCRRPVYSIFEEVKLGDRRNLDDLTLQAIGFDRRALRNEMLDRLYDAATELVRARLSRASGQGGGVRHASGNPG